MSTQNTTFKSTAEHGPEAIEQARATYRQSVLTGLEVKIIDPSYIEPVMDHTAEVELLPIGAATVYPDGRAEYSPAQPIEDILTGLHYQPPVEDWYVERVREWAANHIVKGITTEKTTTFTGQTVADFIGDKIKHPPFSVDREKSNAGFAFDQIEHASAVETMTTKSFTAEGSLEIITTCPDYRDDMDRLERPIIDVRHSERDDARIIGAPEDLKALGHFLIEQADRFQKMLDEAVEVMS